MRVLALAFFLLAACDSTGDLGSDIDAGPDAAPAVDADPAAPDAMPGVDAEPAPPCDHFDDAGVEVEEHCPVGEVCIEHGCYPCGEEGQPCCHVPAVHWCTGQCGEVACQCDDEERVCR